MKTVKLTGAALDWAVAKCEGGYNFDGSGLPWCPDESDQNDQENGAMWFKPSVNWAQGGPIIERNDIKLFPNMGGTWSAQIRRTKSHPLVSHPVLAGWTNASGETPLVAAMRCYVGSKLGDNVDIPAGM